MYLNISSTVDTLLNEQGLSWDKLNRAHKSAVVEAVDAAHDKLKETGLVHKGKHSHRRFSRIDDEQSKEVIIFDESTGEVIPPRHHLGSTHDFPNQTDPSLASDSDELIERFEKGRLFRANYSIYRSPITMDFLRDGSLSLGEWKTLDCLIENLTIRNFSMTSLKALKESLGIDASLLRRNLNSLRKKGCIRIENRDMHKRGDRLIAINPVYGFRGNQSLQEMLVTSWYQEIEPSGHESTH